MLDFDPGETIISVFVRFGKICLGTSSLGGFLSIFTGLFLIKRRAASVRVDSVQ